MKDQTLTWNNQLGCLGEWSYCMSPNAMRRLSMTSVWLKGLSVQEVSASWWTADKHTHTSVLLCWWVWLQSWSASSNGERNKPTVTPWPLLTRSSSSDMCIPVCVGRNCLCEPAEAKEQSGVSGKRGWRVRWQKWKKTTVLERQVGAEHKKKRARERGGKEGKQKEEPGGRWAGTEGQSEPKKVHSLWKKGW